MKGQAKVCKFIVTCPAEECGQEVSYSDKLCSHVIVKGITDMEIQEQVLTLAAMEQDLTLKRITEFMLPRIWVASPAQDAAERAV